MPSRKDNAAASFRAILDRLMTDTQDMDDAMRANLDMICMAAETEMLNNWRGLLAEPYCSALPWWLDGTLEVELERVRNQASAWRSRRLSDATASESPQAEIVRPAMWSTLPTGEDYALAAGSSQTSDQLIIKLASESTESSRTTDYRIAWAHFLASVYRGTQSGAGSGAGRFCNWQRT